METVAARGPVNGRGPRFSVGGIQFPYTPSDDYAISKINNIYRTKQLPPFLQRAASGDNFHLENELYPSQDRSP